MDTPYFFIKDLNAQVTGLAPDSILSRSLYSDDQIRVFLFTFAPGQELSEHTASVPAIIHILEGDVRLTLGKDEFDAGPGAWAHMQAQLPHSVYAKTPTNMLLIMMKDK
jgi:quercetin dioxygenase-like cupin family protein